MSTLSVLKWFGVKREVHFVGYNRDHTACFVRDEQNDRRAITLYLPKHFDLRFRENPVGKHGSPPVEILPVALHVPACFTDETEKTKYIDRNSDEFKLAKTFGHELWKFVTQHKCSLEQKDEPKLSKLLNAELERLRRLQKIRAKETADQIAALPPGETKRVEELRNMLRGEFTTSARGENGTFNSISIFDTTLQMVRQGWGDLREKLLERKWAEDLGVNLETMQSEAAAFHTWLGNIVYNARQTTTNLNTHAVEIGFGLKLDPWQWEILEAAVSYEIRFADGSRCWLDEIEERVSQTRRKLKALTVWNKPPRPLATNG
jgi:hypothetical protein